MGIRDLRRHGVGVGRMGSLLEHGDESATMESPGDVELVPDWNDVMNGYLALLRGTLCVSCDKGELDNL
jgi:hypothetical protein